MDSSELERKAMEEILREAKNAAERAKEMGASGWLKPVVPRTNKRFLHNTLVSTMRDLRRPGRYRRSWSRSSSRSKSRSRSRSRSRSPIISRHVHPKKSRREERHEKRGSKHKGKEKSKRKEDSNDSHPKESQPEEMTNNIEHAMDISSKADTDNGVIDNPLGNGQDAEAKVSPTKEKHKKKKSKKKKKKSHKKKSHKKHKV